MKEKYCLPSDIYKWTIDDVALAQQKWEENSDSETIEPTFQWMAAQWLLEQGEKYKKTADKSLILDAISECAKHDLPLPLWCKNAFLIAYQDVMAKKYISWDDVFGRPHPKGTHTRDERTRSRDARNIYRRINEIVAEKQCPIDGNLFEKVGRELGIGAKTKVSELYYEVKHFFEKLEEAPKNRKNII
jgi:hypothetical protein